MITNTRKRAFLLFPAAVAATLFLAACGGTEAPPQPTAEQSEQTDQISAEFNNIDVMFARMMIPHHEQAVEMSRLAEDRAGDDVKELAAKIEAAQVLEIEQFNQMLESWGEEPVNGMGGMDHYGMGGMGGMGGMMTDEQMAELEQAEGDAFDTMFLEMMIPHHEGAIAMAENELANGVNPETTELAQAIVKAQEAEIEQMNTMLGDNE